MAALQLCGADCVCNDPSDVHVAHSGGGNVGGAGVGTGSQLDGAANKAIHGSVGLVTLPGYGPVLGSAGRLVLVFTPIVAEDGNPTFDVEVVAECGVVGSREASVCFATLLASTHGRT